MRVVFVICQEDGCEGWSAPIQAFESLDEAKAAHALMSHVESLGVFEVPIWPIFNKKPWFGNEPIWPEKSKVVGGGHYGEMAGNHTAGGTGGRDV